MNASALFTIAHKMTRESVKRFGGDYRVTFAAALRIAYQESKMIEQATGLTAVFTKDGFAALIETRTVAEACAEAGVTDYTTIDNVRLGDNRDAQGREVVYIEEAWDTNIECPITGKRGRVIYK